MNAMHGRFFLVGLGIAVLGGSGCQKLSRRPVAPTTQQQEIRVNCLSLLHQLLDQQRNVDKLLLVKKESPELHRLVKAIASASASGAQQIETFAANDPSVRLDQVGLPPGEVATRDAIARTRTRELLKPFNADFELALLLTQSEALSYAWHLATVAAAHEHRQERAIYLAALGDEMKGLHGRTVALMNARTTPQSRASQRDR